MQIKSKILDKIGSLGWVVCFALIGVMVGSGFQPAADKSAVVNLDKAIKDSEPGKKDLAAFNEMKSSRNGLLQFVQQNPILTTEQALRMRELWLKAGASEAEKAELEKIKGDVQASAKKWQDLSQKQNLTPEETTLMQDFEGRRRTMQETVGRWYREFGDEIEAWTAGRAKTSLDKAQAALSSIAKAQGYTLVFDSDLARYGANDLTQAVTQALNAQP